MRGFIPERMQITKRDVLQRGRLAGVLLHTMRFPGELGQVYAASVPDGHGSYLYYELADSGRGPRRWGYRSATGAQAAPYGGLAYVLADLVKLARGTGDMRAAELADRRRAGLEPYAGETF
jgi:hypothetical protein